MKTSVNLQEPFTYSVIPLVIVIVLIIGFTIYLIITRKVKTQKKQEKSRAKKIPERNIKDIKQIKERYLKQLDTIESEYNNQKIELRQAYMLISEAVRMFVFEATDIKTQNYSLNEIKKMNLPVLYDLIKEYYEPEFAFKPVGDFSSSINKARSVILKWN